MCTDRNAVLQNAEICPQPQVLHDLSSQSFFSRPKHVVVVLNSSGLTWLISQMTYYVSSLTDNLHHFSLHRSFRQEFFFIYLHPRFQFFHNTVTLLHSVSSIFTTKIGLIDWRPIISTVFFLLTYWGLFRRDLFIYLHLVYAALRWRMLCNFGRIFFVFCCSLCTLHWDVNVVRYRAAIFSVQILDCFACADDLFCCTPCVYSFRCTVYTASFCITWRFISSARRRHSTAD